jgi:hypothetical protein
MIELTPEQSRELSTNSLRVIDPKTHTRYVLVPEDVYERLEALLVPGRLTAAEQQTVLRAAGLRAGWDDPEMDVYDHEESQHKP